MTESMSMRHHDLASHRRFPQWMHAAAMPATAMLACLTPSCNAVPRSASPDGPPITLIVHVTGARDGLGPVRCALYRDSAAFMTRDGIWQGASAPSVEGGAAFSFVVPAGCRLAVSVFQDLDDDAAFDRGPFGIPAEPWGTSGKFSPLMPPSWQRSSIIPDRESAEVSIALVGGPGPRPEPGR